MNLILISHFREDRAEHSHFLPSCSQLPEPQNVRFSSRKSVCLLGAFEIVSGTRHHQHCNNGALACIRPW